MSLAASGPFYGGENIVTRVNVLPEAEVLPNGLELYDRYTHHRDAAALQPDHITSERLAEVQKILGDRLEKSGLISKPNYAEISHQTIAEKWSWLASEVTNLVPTVTQDELQATDLFRQSSFSMFEETPDVGKSPDADGSFAFMVPIRMDSEHPEYGEEVESVVPLLRYIPNTMRAKMLVGLSPTVIDRYEKDQDGTRGYLVFVPIYSDEAITMRRGAKRHFIVDSIMRIKSPFSAKNQKEYKTRVQTEAVDRANTMINLAADFANRRLGADIIGLGAIIPALSRFGSRIKNPDVITTTGHGGTVQLILDTLRRAEADKIGRAETVRKIGILGLGSIGASIAEVIAEKYAHRPEVAISIYDQREAVAERTLEKLHQNTTNNVVSVSPSAAELMDTCDVVVSAITTPLNPSQLKLADGTLPNMNGLVFIDDSQPGSVTREEAQRHGINLMWVIGEQSGNSPTLRRTLFDYGTMASKSNVFGCEAEAGSLAEEKRRLVAAGFSEQEALEQIRDLAVQGPVNVSKVRAIGQLFVRSRINAAQPQSFGKLLEVKS